MGEDQRPSRVRYIVLVGLCLAAAIAYVHRACFGVAESTIRGELGLTVKQMGWAMGLFFWTYALFQIPTGILVDRWGPRKSLLLFGMAGALTMAFAGLASAGQALLPALMAGFVILVASRVLMGIAQAGLFPASTRCFAYWFPVRQRGLATGSLQASMQAGSVIAMALTGWVIAQMHWSLMFFVFAVPGVVWSLWFFWWFRDRPAEHPSLNDAERDLLKLPPDAHADLESRAPTPWLRLFTRPKLIWLCSQQFFRAAAFAFWMTWCPTFLQKVYLMTPAQSGLLTAFPTLGLVLGTFSGGLLADRVLRATGSKRWSRQGVAMITAAIGVTLFAVA